MKSPSDFDFFERLQGGIRKGVLMAFDAHFKAGQSVVIYGKEKGDWRSPASLRRVTIGANR